jgi:purine-binding chemotaxis protein CheW
MPLARREPRAPVNWAEIRRRLEAVGRSLAGETAASPERTREVLLERARALARPAVSTPAGDRLELVTFTLANETYALESRSVMAVFRLTDLSPLPGAEPPVSGLTVWRGELLTILDLRPLVGLSVTALNDLSRVVVLGAERPEFGVLADAVLQIVSLPATAVEPLPQGGPAKHDYLRGMTRAAVLVLDGERLLRLFAPDPREDL